GQHEEELLAAVAGDDVDLADAVAQAPRDLREDCVADDVPVSLVDALEVVDVEHRARERVAEALGSLELFREAGVEVTVVVEARQLVADRQPLEASSRV